MHAQEGWGGYVLLIQRASISLEEMSEMYRSFATGPNKCWCVADCIITVWKNSYAEHEVTGKTYN